LRWFSGAISHINASKELVKKYNAAFGISMAGVVLGITIVLTGAIYGDPIHNLMGSVIAVGLYGIIGIVLMALTRIIFDKICLPKISIRDQIVQGNVAAGIIDAGNVIATALVIRAVMVWVQTNTLEGIGAVLLGYIISQVLLTLATYLRVKWSSAKLNGKSLGEEFEGGNVAIALTFAGRRIGTAFAITAASNIMVYELFDIQTMLAAWAVVSIIMILLLKLLSFIADSIILYKVDVEDEVINQSNLAIGAVQSIIYVSLGLLLAELMA
jgi:uncharacterized membrane protein YjfL (UPF0719 family)